jgi:glutaminyl-peptide cyclotransferase
MCSARPFAVFIAAAWFAWVCLYGVLAAGLAGTAPTYSYEVVRAWPHDRSAYTQGLVFVGGAVYESTGLYGHSSLRKLELASGRVVQQRDLARSYFGEGLTALRNRLYQLTWRSRTGFVYDLASFEPLGEFSYEGEGWGLTNDGRQLIMSDGSPTLRFIDPASYAVVKTLDVHDVDRPVSGLNELEYVRGEIYANVFQTDRIARIDPVSGQVLGWIDLSGLLSAEDRRAPVDVLNGIAYDPAQDRLFVTGKLWPKLFEIKLRAKK